MAKLLGTKAVRVLAGLAAAWNGFAAFGPKE